MNKITAKNLINNWNKRLFWRCYHTEQSIRDLLCFLATKQLSASHARAFAKAAFAFAFLLAVIPAVAFSEAPAVVMQKVFDPLQPIFKQFSPEQGLNVFLAGDIANADAGASFPDSPLREPRRLQKVVVTFYSSTIDQTDDTPFITANGTRVRYGIAAANFLSFGTRIKIPDIFGEEVFVVHDRMNQRFGNRVDIWVATREEAIERGVHYTTVEVY
mgnify:CR=1 FL=1